MSGVRRIDLDATAIAVDLPPVSTPLPPDTAAFELAAARAELAEARAALKQAHDEISGLRAQLDAAPASGFAAEPAPAVIEPVQEAEFNGPATLRRVVVSEAPSALESDEQRSALRYPCEFEVEFAHDTHFTAGVSSDMSTGGLFVATYHRVPIGSAVSVAFDLPNGHRVEARGEVRWARTDDQDESRPGIGIAFTDLSDGALAHIVEFCRSRPPLCFEV